jgi:hypothetical protein
MSEQKKEESKQVRILHDNKLFGLYGPPVML